MFRMLSGSPMSCDGCGRHAASAAVRFLRRTHKVSSYRVISEQFVARGWTCRCPVPHLATPASREPDRRPIHGLTPRRAYRCVAHRTCYFTEDYRFALDRFQSRKRTGSGYGRAHHLFYIRVPLTARRALANPFGRVLSAVATYIYSLFFHTAKVWKYFFISFPNSQICFLLSLQLSEHHPDNTHRPGQHTCGTSSVRFLFHHLG